jgi:hypothetical protein
MKSSIGIKLSWCMNNVCILIHPLKQVSRVSIIHSISIPVPLQMTPRILICKSKQLKAVFVSMVDFQCEALSEPSQPIFLLLLV